MQLIYFLYCWLKAKFSFPLKISIITWIFHRYWELGKWSCLCFCFNFQEVLRKFWLKCIYIYTHTHIYSKIWYIFILNDIYLLIYVDISYIYAYILYIYMIACLYICVQSPPFFKCLFLFMVFSNFSLKNIMTLTFWKLSQVLQDTQAFKQRNN